MTFTIDATADCAVMSRVASLRGNGPRAQFGLRKIRV